MRVIAGRWGGRTLPARVPKGTRPTQDAVREAIFNILTNLLEWEELRVLDLFAGTGAFGIEALSRGAAWCTFVERSLEARKAIAENCCTLGIEQSTYRIVGGDAALFLKRSEEFFHVVFADPPYNQMSAIHRFWGQVEHAQCIAPGALVVLEHTAAIIVPVPSGFALVQQRQWGQSACTILQRK